MKTILPIITFFFINFCAIAQQKGPIHWLGSTAQNGGVGGTMYLDTPANTYTIYGYNFAYTGYAPVCNQCPAFNANNGHYMVYRTYDTQHNLIKKSCVKVPNVFNTVYTVSHHERTPDGHFIYGGAGPNYHSVLCKADSFGNVIWKDSFFVGLGNGIAGVKKLSNHHYVFYGQVHRIGGLVDTHYGSWMDADYFLFEADTLGTVYWKKLIGGTGEDAYPFVKEKSHGVYFLGMTYSNQLNIPTCKGQQLQGLVAARINDTGGIDCSYRHYMGLRIWDAVVEPNDDLVMFNSGPQLTGTNPMNQNKRFQLCKIDSNGNQIWWKQYGFDVPTSSSTYNMGISKNPINDGYICWGTINNKWNVPLGDIAQPLKGEDDIWIIFLDKNGNLESQLSYGGTFWDANGQLLYYPANHTFLMQGGTRSGDGDFVGGHFTPGITADGEAFVSEITYWPNRVSNSIKGVAQLVKVYPNPAQNVLNIDFATTLIPEGDKTLRLTNLSGQTIKQYSVANGIQHVQLETGALPPATYILSITINKTLLQSERIIIKP